MAGAPVLDDLSRQVIALLQDDGRISFREMGKRLGVSPATVRSRYNQLRDDHVIQIVAAPNPRKLGWHFHAVISVRLEPGHLEQAVDILEKRPEVTWIGLTLNDYELMFELVSRSAQSFGSYKEQLLSQLPGFVSADVQVLWDVRKFRYAVTTDGQSDDQGPSTSHRKRIRSGGRTSPKTNTKTQ